VRVKSCECHGDWLKEVKRRVNFYINDKLTRETVLREMLRDEAQREGFESWCSLLDWFKAHGIDINDTYRIKFTKEAMKE